MFVLIRKLHQLSMKNIYLMYIFVLVNINHVSSWKSKLLKNAYTSLKGFGNTIIISHLLTLVNALTNVN